jgi:hypothetical protein
MDVGRGSAGEGLGLDGRREIKDVDEVISVMSGLRQYLR